VGRCGSNLNVLASESTPHDQSPNRLIVGSRLREVEAQLAPTTDGGRMTGNTEIVARAQSQDRRRLAQDAAVCCHLNKRRMFALSECWVVDYSIIY
jgi:hypothetical protein